ncbi:MAG TPA: hypothetical protein VN911_19980, partial [Candidatus Acidoferrum sp.]|nr:hypothetical protein [Candidatus Acidoferrum sp.]
MRFVGVMLVLACVLAPALAQEKADEGPADEKAQKTYAAKVRFEEFVKTRAEDDPDRQRALRYIGQPELARARMAPPFAVTTT